MSNERFHITVRDEIAGFHIEEDLGVVRASIVFARGIGKEWWASISDKLGGRSKSWSRSFEEAQDEACDKAYRQVMEADCGGNAIVGVRFDFGTTQRDMAYCVMTGQAVRVRPKSD